MKYQLQDLIDIEHFQNLQDRLNKIYSFPSSIIDNDGNILTATAWQAVCTQFHRKNKESEKLCIQSDRYISNHLHEANPAVSYRCPHGLVDNATPIVIDGIHYGNFFTGQFFLEKPDLDFFRNQAKKYGFDENAYIEAIKKVPIWTQEQLDNYLFFIKGLIAVISESGLKRLKEIENRKQIQKSEKRYKSILKAAMDGYWRTDIDGRLLEVNDAYCSMSGYSENELLSMRIMDLEAVETPELVFEHMKMVIAKGSDRFESKHRRKDGTLFDVEVSIQFRPEEGGQSVCFFRDISESKRSYDALKKSERKMGSIFRAAPIGIGVVVNRVFQDVNDRFCEITGYSRDELIGENARIVYPSDSEYAYVGTHKYEQISNNGTGSVDTRFKRKDGKIIDVLLSSTPLDPGDLSAGVTFTALDITERKQAEEKQRKLEKQLSSAMQIAHLGHWEYDVENDLFFFNDQFYMIFHTTAEQAGGYSMSAAQYANRFVHPEDIEIVGKEIRKSIETTDPDFSQELEHRILYADGKVGYIAVRYFVIKDAQGKTVKTFGVNQDITERKQAEAALRESEEQFRHFFEHLTIGVAVYEAVEDGKDFVVYDVNPAGQELSKISIDEIRGKRLTQIFPGARDQELLKALQNTWRTGHPTHVPFTMYQDERINQWVEFRVFKVPSGRVVAVYDDRTKLMRLEEELRKAQKMESIGNLAGGIAHDFNNILFPIVGLAEMLLEDLSPGNVERENAEEIFKAGKRGRDLVKQILAFSRQSEHKMIPIRIQNVLKEAINLSRSTIPTYIKIKQDIQKDCGMVLADPSQIHQIAMNIITNAYHALQNANGIISVRYRQKVLEYQESVDINLSPGAYAVLSISDTGHGMSEELIGKIFDPYFSTKEQGKGTGLGLAVVYGIVKEHGGDIKVYSEIGKGSKFDIFLPLMKKTNVTESIPELEKYQGGNERILLVDDEEAIARLEKLRLERMGGRNRSGIKAGCRVRVVQKQDQRTGKLTEGIVKDILTRSSTHPHGIKVRLTSGVVGRVKEILSAME